MTVLMRYEPLPARSAPVRRRATRAAAAVASGGLIVGMGAAGAAPAFAATSDDCDGTNTLTAPGDGAADIQALLDADTAIVCLSGSFPLTEQLTFDHSLTLFGLSGAELNGQNLTRIIEGTTGSSLTVQNLAMVDGSGAFGGAILIDGDLLVENSRFDSNSAVLDGGAIYVEDSSGNDVEIIDSVFVDNATGVADPDGYSGGAIYNRSSDFFAIQGSTFTGNSASEFGGAVFGYAVLVSDSTFTDNVSSEAGGGLYGVLMASIDSTFTGNESPIGGGVAGGTYGAAIGTTFVENTAELAGGGFAGYGAALVLNSTFVGNDTNGVGGALAGAEGQIALSTFLDNTAQGDEGGESAEAVFIYPGIDDSNTMSIGGSIFAGSRGLPQLGRIDEVDAPEFADEGGNVFSTSQAVETALTAPAESTLFSRSKTEIFGSSPALAGNGGTTQTVALVPGSPAIDAVPADVFEDGFGFGPTASTGFAEASEFAAASELAATSDSPDLDQRGEERTGLRDAGAFEFGDAELAATGPASTNALGWLGAALLAAGAMVVASTRGATRRATR
ncbi:MAG: choice-of-anchor Q domain-containing protein [Microcella sp.]|uniref:choice-of-anchor Q domain-containing protein n=1 Tax=Microcella sp. TaxID=1913979 RepID=UPI0033163884